MNSFDGYVLNSELAEKAKISKGLIKSLENVVTRHMGTYVLIKTDTVPNKYKEVAKKCTDLSGYLAFSFLAELLGMDKCYLYVMENQGTHKFESIKVGRIRLFKLSEEFKRLWNKGKTPFYINRETKSYADEIIEMQGLKIGFY